ncbi:hypothetical protein CBR_g8977 [Chara braunii]|uniref:Uncharacterized protein n=1 Tax=Chara braunii TaxID=69332 RepID=A0A388KNE4_CHABU|nr:hypothetical protein CBR_g8977 [Chara braunii]|eukprot:GBG71561.1 hypothetical protein CBR_g8977 [Chara braunii]
MWVSAEAQLAAGLKRLAAKVKPTWFNGKFVGTDMSAKNIARVRRQVLLVGEEWPYDKPRKEMKTRVKGHKVDRIAQAKREKTKELMEQMPQLLADMKNKKKTKKS